MADDPVDLIETAADIHDVDLDHAVVGLDRHPASDRVYLLEDQRDGSYRLIGFGQDANGKPAAEEPITFGLQALNDLGMLFHAASLQRSENMLADEDDRDGLSIRQVAEGFNLSDPLRGDR